MTATKSGSTNKGTTEKGDRAEEGTEAAAADAGEAQVPQKTVAAALGEVAWLLSQSPSHRHSLFVGDLDWLVMPALMHGQYRLFNAQNRPVGVALWAFVSEEVERRLAGGGRLGANEWRSGDRVWLVDLVAPFGNQDQMLADLQSTALADRKFRYIRVQPNGKRETVEVQGDAVP